MNILKAVSTAMCKKTTRLGAIYLYKRGDAVRYVATNDRVLIAFDQEDSDFNLESDEIVAFNKDGIRLSLNDCAMKLDRLERVFPLKAKPTEEVCLNAAYLNLLYKSLRTLKVKNPFFKITMHGANAQVVFERTLMPYDNRLCLSGRWSALVMPLRF